jgi:hypothetical protein
MLFAYTLPEDPASEEIVRKLVQMGLPFKNISLVGNEPAKEFLSVNGYGTAPHLFDGNSYVGSKSEDIDTYFKEK